MARLRFILTTGRALLSIRPAKHPGAEIAMPVCLNRRTRSRCAFQAGVPRNAFDKKEAR
jgi:hypothetical protein